LGPELNSAAARPSSRRSTLKSIHWIDLPGFAGHVSTGMSGDFELAVKFGATHVRVGTAIFGARAPLKE
jgi:uncharacterized pyridoxal phosphate-containing UPF0001 family protein